MKNFYIQLLLKSTAGIPCILTHTHMHAYMWQITKQIFWSVSYSEGWSMPHTQGDPDVCGVLLS